jgi:hypothetical protein
MKILLATIMAVVALSSPAQAGDIPSPPDPVFPRGLPYAPSEGECYTYRCVWDAKHQGNGEGQSMILTRWHGGYVGKPITHRRAHRLHTAYCERKNVTCRGYED